ncbi:MAG TPA: ECF-type sigma factor [Gemmata sp.]|nr:ECF-type sigma factor [Gemmata sp.]
MSELDGGNQEAARQLYERFIDRMVALAAKTLDKSLGAKVDPESVALSVFESFFEGRRKGEITLHNWGMVLGVLSHITFRKCLNRNRHLRTQKRDASVEVPFEDWRKATAEPGPAETAILSELLMIALAGFDEDERAILDQFMSGETVDKVAKTIRLSTRTVHRIIERFRKRIETLLSEE